MNLRKIIEQIAMEHENGLIGEGENFQKEQTSRIENFIQRFEFLIKDLDYCEYLIKISALSFYYKVEEEDFTLLGFDGGKTVLFEGGEYNEPLIDSKGYFLFGYYNFMKEEKISELYFNSTPNTEKGIFVKRKHDYQNKEVPYILICKGFKEFLTLVKENKLKEIINK